MKKIKCSDLGSADCHFEATGETNEEVKQKLWQHAQEAHPDMLKDITDEQKEGMNKKIDALLAAQG